MHLNMYWIRDEKGGLHLKLCCACLLQPVTAFVNQVTLSTFPVTISRPFYIYNELTKFSISLVHFSMECEAHTATVTILQFPKVSLAI